MNATELNINELKPHPRYSEFFDDMSGEEWEGFLNSVKSDGVIEPIIITSDKIIMSGHQRVRACKELGITKIMGTIRTYDNEDDIVWDMIFANSSRVKKIKSRVKQVHTVATAVDINEKRIKAEKQRRDAIVKEHRKFISSNRETIIETRGNKCEVCGMGCKGILMVHHILPLQQGGNNDKENLVVVCPNCHALLHKDISFYKNGSVDLLEFTDDWCKRNYSSYANEAIMSLGKKYLRFRRLYGWEDLH